MPTFPVFQRYIENDGTHCPKSSGRSFETQLHAAYTHWVRNHCHLRDFSQAVAHCASLSYTNYLLEGAPDLRGAAPVPCDIELAPAGRIRRDGQALRLYDEVNDLSPEVKLDIIEQAVSAGFIDWCADGFLPRDFISYATDVAAVMVYDHMLCQQLAGLGGGRTEEQFLCQPYKK